MCARTMFITICLYVHSAVVNGFTFFHPSEVCLPYSLNNKCFSVYVLYSFIHAYLYVCVCVYVCMYVRTYVRTSARTCMHVCMHARTNVGMFACRLSVMYV